VHNDVPWTTLTICTSTTTKEENNYLEWFRLRTSKKAPGIFVSSFWDRLVFQVSSREPAVLHAALALSSIQKREIYFGKDSRGSEIKMLDAQEEFMLQHYTKAIGHLQPHFSVKDRSSVRVALVTCVIFICLENLRGHFRTAQTHLKNGLKLLEEMQIADFADQCIVEEFTKLHVQVELLRLSYQHPCPMLQATEPEVSSTTFGSTCDARQKMDQILSQIFHLTEQARGEILPKFGTYSTDLLNRQALIRAQLVEWHDTYNASDTNLRTHKLVRDKSLQVQIIMRDRFAYGLLRIWHIIAGIMASAALWPGCEWKFNCHTSDFISVLTQTIGLRMIVPATQKALYGTGNELTRSIFHIGVMPALYYTAIKCRVHRVRLQAVRLLESTSHREGLWDAKIVACIARKVMEIEEGDFYKNYVQYDDFPLFNAPEEPDLLIPALPDSHRVHEVEVVLPESPMARVELLCRRKREDGSWDTLVNEYDLIELCWRVKHEFIAPNSSSQHGCL
jgi:hypothetical protein